MQDLKIGCQPPRLVSTHVPCCPGGYMRTGTGTGEEVSHEQPRFFVTGACGQIGQEFLPFLRSK
jgi:hypothetical protein